MYQLSEEKKGIMRLSFFKTSRPSEVIDEELELDITPLMNIFIILVAFLISMAIFTRLAIVEFSLPPNVNSEMNSSDQKPVPKLTVRLDPVYIGIILGEQVLDSLPVIKGEFPFVALSEKLSLRNKENNTTGEIVVASVDAIPFKLIVKTMDICRVAGFEKVGLSSATVDPGSGL
jgi:biopolymer transport protein ExbD